MSPRLRRLSWWVAACTVVSLTACGGGGDAVTPPPTPPATVAVATVSVTPTTASVAAGATTALTAETRDANGALLSGRSVSWSSASPAVATVSASGVVTGVGAGTTQITATSEGRSGSAAITVTPPPVATVIITPDSGDVVVRGTATLAAATRDAAGAALTGRAITWSSGNTAIATVSTAGVVTAVTSGTVTISASSEGKTGTARVRVVSFNLAAALDSIRQQYNLPALGGAIITRNNGVIALGVSGTRRFGVTLPVTTNDKWHIGSNSKAFTGLLAGLAVKAGRMSWSDLLTTRYTELAPLARAEFRTATLLDLAGMRTGIVGNPAGFTPTGTDAQMRNQVDTWAVQQAPVSTPGSYYYSNINYQLLGEVSARAFGQSYTQALQERIFAPLGITTAGFGPTTAAGGTDQPSGHTPSGNGWTVCEACDNAWALGSGKIHLSLGDWSKFAWELLRADAGQSTMLTQSEARALTSSITNENASTGYGYGWSVFLNQAQRIVQHDGSNTRNLSRALVYLDAGVAFLFVTNAADAASSTGGTPIQAFTALNTRLQSYYQNNR
jgi:CubicO group peptidase (beta-lactamase class C family)